MSSKFIQSWLCSVSATPLVAFRIGLASNSRVPDLSGNIRTLDNLGSKFLVQAFGGTATYLQLQFMINTLDATAAAAAIAAIGAFSATPTVTGVADNTSVFYHIPNNQILLIDLPHGYDWFSARSDAAGSLILTRVDERGVR